MALVVKAGIICRHPSNFMFETHSTNHLLGNIGVVYNNLQKVASLSPVSGNRGGSYLTFWSIDGLKFGILQAVSCWGECSFLSIKLCPFNWLSIWPPKTSLQHITCATPWQEHEAQAVFAHDTDCCNAI